MRQETGDSSRRGTCFIFNYSFKIASAKTEVAQAADGQQSQSASIAFTCIPSPSTGILRAHNMTSSQLEEHSTGIGEVMGSNPVQTGVIFRVKFR